MERLDNKHLKTSIGDSKLKDLFENITECGKNPVNRKPKSNIDYRKDDLALWQLKAFIDGRVKDDTELGNLVDSATGGTWKTFTQAVGSKDRNVSPTHVEAVLSVMAYLLDQHLIQIIDNLVDECDLKGIQIPYLRAYPKIRKSLKTKVSEIEPIRHKQSEKTNFNAKENELNQKNDEDSNQYDRSEIIEKGLEKPLHVNSVETLDVILNKLTPRSENVGNSEVGKIAFAAQLNLLSLELDNEQDSQNALSICEKAIKIVESASDELLVRYGYTEVAAIFLNYSVLLQNSNIDAAIAYANKAIVKLSAILDSDFEKAALQLVSTLNHLSLCYFAKNNDLDGFNTCKEAVKLLNECSRRKVSYEKIMLADCLNNLSVIQTRLDPEKVVFKILCHFNEISVQEMTYDKQQTDIRYGSGFAGLA